MRRVQDISRYEVLEDHIKEGATEEEVSLLDLSRGVHVLALKRMLQCRQHEGMLLPAHEDALEDVVLLFADGRQKVIRGAALQE